MKVFGYHVCLYLHFCSHNSGIVLLLAVLSSMDGNGRQTKAVPMCRGYSSYSYQITTTTLECYTTTYAVPVPAYYTEASKYYPPPKAPEYHTTNYAVTF